MINKKHCEICNENSFKLLFNKKGFDIYKCQKCELTFTNIPENFNLSEIYDESYFQGGQEDGYGNYIGSEQVLRKEFQNSIKQIRKLTNYRENLKLLEVGSAYGFFLDEAKPYFNCTGLEISETAVKFSRERGHNTICGIVEKSVLDSIGNVDVIVMFDVIEHLPIPSETIQLLTEKLNKNGILVIVTGDVSSILARVMKSKWRLMTPPQHTFFFSKNTLKKLLKKNNLSVVETSRPWKFVPLGLAFYQVAARFGFKARWTEKFNNRGVYVNLFDTVKIIGRK